MYTNYMSKTTTPAKGNTMDVTTNDYDEARATLDHLEHHCEDADYIEQLGGTVAFDALLQAAFDNFYRINTK